MYELPDTNNCLITIKLVNRHKQLLILPNSFPNSPINSFPIFRNERELFPGIGLVLHCYIVTIAEQFFSNVLPYYYLNSYLNSYLNRYFPFYVLPFTPPLYVNPSSFPSFPLPLLLLYYYIYFIPSPLTLPFPFFLLPFSLNPSFPSLSLLLYL